MKLKLFGKEYSFFVKNTSLPIIQNETGWQQYLQGKGHIVSHDTAIRVAAVIRCADVVAKTMASLGCHLYKETDNGKERAKSSPLYKLLRYMPNPETTSFDFWHMYIFNLMLTNGGYAKIVRDASGFIKEIWNIPSCSANLQRDMNTGERYLDVVLNKKIDRLYEGYFMYTPSLRFTDAEDTEDFIHIARDVLGLTINLNSFARDHFENGSNMGGFISYPSGIGAVAFNKFKEDWAKAYSGVMNQHKWALLEGGFSATPMGSDPEKSQALESRKFQILEICRIMGVPPHKVFDLERATHNNIEQANIEYVQETISPMNERITQTIYKDLLNSREQVKLYANFNINALLKGDTAARTSYYNSMRQNGIMNANEIRELEEMNYISVEAGGDDYFINGNMLPLTAAKQNLPKSAQTKGVST